MPTIEFNETLFECEAGDNLRRVLLKAGAPIYNGVAGAFHCRGMGTCGTCAVSIEGPVSEITPIEKWRLGFPPHRLESGLRLACQCGVLGDLRVRKFPGLWGHKSGPTS